MIASSVMMPDVVTVKADASVREVAKILLANRISAVPVVDEQGRVVGIISEGDLVRRPELGTERPRAWWLDALSPNATLADDFVRSHSRKVSDVMTRNVVVAGPSELAQPYRCLARKAPDQAGTHRQRREARRDREPRKPRSSAGQPDGGAHGEDVGR